MKKWIILILLTLTIQTQIMANHKELIPKILKWEGGFVWNKNDKGGATNSGVTLTTFRSVYGRNKTVNDLKKMTPEQWEYIFKTKYWDKWNGDSIDNQAIADFVIDWYWHSGIYGIKYPQQILGVEADGIVGKKTLAAINNHPFPEELFKALWERRKKQFDNIIKNNPKQKVFYKGWMNRIQDFKYE